MLWSQTLRPCFRPVSAMIDAQTSAVHRNTAALFHQWEMFYVFEIIINCLCFLYTCMLCFVWFLWVLFFGTMPDWHLKSSLLHQKGICARTKTAGTVSYPSKFSIALHGNKRWWRRREKTIGSYDPCGECRLWVRDSTRRILKQSTVTSCPSRQISVQLPWHIPSLCPRTGRLFKG